MAATTWTLQCEQARELLSELIDRELDVDRSSAVTHHLRACPRCATFAAQLARVVHALHGLRAGGSICEWLCGRGAHGVRQS